jgi:uncharacterized protein
MGPCVALRLTAVTMALIGLLSLGVVIGYDFTAGGQWKVMTISRKRHTSTGMSRANVEVVRKIYEAFNRRDIDGILDGMDPEIEIEETQDLAYAARLLRVLGPRFVVLSGAYQGREEVRKLFEAVWVISEWFQADPEEFVDGDEWVVVALRLRARGRNSGEEGEAVTAHAWTMRDGKAAKLRVYAEREQALEAVRLRTG